MASPSITTSATPSCGMNLQTTRPPCLEGKDLVCLVHTAGACCMSGVAALPSRLAAWWPSNCGGRGVQQHVPYGLAMAGSC